MPRFLLLLFALAAVAQTPEGCLTRVDPYGKHTGELCPLKHTDVRATVSGPLARVNVTQDFENNTPDKIEAIYTFPLPHNAAVDDMTLTVGSRTIRGLIKRRDEARKIYEDAKNRGNVAALLDQEKPNIFTQSVANIEPGAKVRVTISYVETLPYEEGAYEFVFPMTVGPRYKPSTPNPKYAPPSVRAGHDLSLRVEIDAGVPLQALTSKSHEIVADRSGSNRAVVVLKQLNTIPNKDFILRYGVAGVQMTDAVLTHRDTRGGFFSLILQPPARVTAEDTTPKELVFVLDTSGSMTGFPIEKAKETMRLALAGLYPRDTFNLITFAGDTAILFPRPVPATAAHLQLAQEFLASRRGSGGTEMMKAIRAALDDNGDRDHIRIVCFMTDGYVGNDDQIIEEVRKHSNARVFSFGIGSSVNRHLLDGMAKAGRGEVEYVSLQDDGSAAARRFHERVRNPLLTDITIDWHGLPVAEVYPTRIPDLFGAKPVVIHGRYTAPGSGSITLRGTMSGRPFSRTIGLQLPATQAANEVLATLWARTRVAALSEAGGNEAEITKLGLDYRLMTAYTSFVAVEETTVTRNGKPVKVQVPVEMPEGVSHEGALGVAAESMALQISPMVGKARAVRGQVGIPGGVPGGVPTQGPGRTPGSVIGEVPGGTAGGVVGGIISRAPQAPPPPPPPPAARAQRQDAPALGDKTMDKLEASLRAALRQTPAERVEIELWLTDWTPEIASALKALGFEDDGRAKVAKIRTGRLRASELEKLAALASVVSIRPANVR